MSQHDKKYSGCRKIYAFFGTIPFLCQRAPTVINCQPIAIQERLVSNQHISLRHLKSVYPPHFLPLSERVFPPSDIRPSFIVLGGGITEILLIEYPWILLVSLTLQDFVLVWKCPAFCRTFIGTGPRCGRISLLAHSPWYCAIHQIISVCSWGCNVLEQWLNGGLHPAI